MNTEHSQTPGYREFVALMATMMSLVALSIDVMLPALPAIGADLNVQNENAPQLVVSAIFLGLAVGQLIFGPLSDSVGRKRAIYSGYVLLIVGCILSIVAVSFQMMLIGRLLQGIGVSAPRGVSMALIRDRFAGRAMAQVMSFVMTVFILMPIIAPSLGQLVLLVTGWRMLFGVLLAVALISLAWFARRQPETLAPEKRLPLRPRRILRAFGEVLTTRVSLGYTLMAGLVSGAFLGYLSSAQQIYQDIFGLGTLFPLFFALSAAAVGAASLTNSQLVVRFGMRSLASKALMVLVLLGAVYFTFALVQHGRPPLWTFMAYIMCSFFCVGILFGNLNAMAMEPLGHIAGVGAAVVGSLTTFISMPPGVFIGQSFNGTVLPLVGGYALLSATALLVMIWIEGFSFRRGRPQETGVP